MSDPAPVQPAREDVTWRPLQRRAYRWLWFGTVATSVGAWAQVLGTQWLYVHDPIGPTIVALVQTASTLPVMLLALPAGVVADVFDRRHLLMVVQVYLAVLSLTMAVLTFLDRMPPALLLSFISASALGAAVQAPAWQPLVAELVPRAHFPATTRLDLVAGNAGRVLGPVIAGLLISHVGTAFVFVFNVVCVAAFLAVLLAWRRPRASVTAPEPFLSALRAGGRYVRHEPAVRRILTRMVLYLVPASALWVLLPLLAGRELGLDSTGYGVLLAAAGLGAIAGAMGAGPLRRVASSNVLVAGAGLVFALSFGGALLTTSPVLAGLLAALAGATWTTSLAATNAEFILALPGWVRARAMAVLVMVFTGAQAAAAPLWGGLAQGLGTRQAGWVVIAAMALGVGVGLLIPMPRSADRDQSPVRYWRDIPTVDTVDADDGRVVLVAEYRVRAGRQQAFLEAMRDVRVSKLRGGALRWELYREASEPDVFLEVVTSASVDEQARQFGTRQTADDHAIDAAALELVAEAPRVRQLLSPQLPPRRHFRRRGRDTAG